jgi:hypothetical protein
MARKFLTNVDLNLSELQNAVVQNLASDPNTGNTDGRIYYNTVSNELRVYANGAWSVVGAISNVVGTADEIIVSVVDGIATLSLPAAINANTTGSAASLTTARAIQLSGDVTGTADFDGTAAINVLTTIAANSVALGTDTTGSYVATATAGTGIGVSGSGGEAAGITISNTGVTNIAGTANQITASASTGSVTLSIPSAVIFPGTVTLNADPTQSLQAATKQYVDSVASGLDVKQSVTVATTANITLSGTQTIDGVAVIVGNRVLVKNQSAPAENGIYVVSESAWSRSSDADSATNITSGMFTFVESGIVNSDTGWALSTDGTVVVGTTSLVFAQFSGAGAYTAGTGLTLTGSEFSLTDTYTKKVSVSVGDGSLTSIPVTHNLGTRDVVVNVYDNATYDTVEVDVVRTNTNIVTVSFSSAPANNAYRVVVIG